MQFLVLEHVLESLGNLPENQILLPVLSRPLHWLQFFRLLCRFLFVGVIIKAILEPSESVYQFG